jgi:hypothetical protein
VGTFFLQQAASQNITARSLLASKIIFIIALKHRYCNAVKVNDAAVHTLYSLRYRWQ